MKQQVNIDVSFDSYNITKDSPEILVKNQTSVVYMMIDIVSSGDVKPIIDKLMRTMRCFLFSMKKRVVGTQIMYEMVVYKLKNTNKPWGYWGAKHNEDFEYNRAMPALPQWNYWKITKKNMP